MQRRDILAFSIDDGVGLAILPGAALAQPKTIKSQLPGTWNLLLVRRGQR